MLLQNTPFDITCPHCGDETPVTKMFTPGNPRNLLYKFHYDGWLPNGIGRSSRGSGSMEVMSACLSPDEAGKVSNIRGNYYTCLRERGSVAD